MTRIYYAKDGYVWRRAAKRTLPDGTSYYASSFRVCKMTDEAGAAAAEALAGMLNLAISTLQRQSGAAETTPDHDSNSVHH